MMNALKIKQEHINSERRNIFGCKTISSDYQDKIIDQEERRINKRRTLCTECNTQKSVSGSCYC